MKTTVSHQTDRDKTALAPLAGSGAPVPLAIQLMHKALFHGQYDAVPDDLACSKHIAELLLYLKQTQCHFENLAYGDISAPIPVDGYSGSLLKTMQDNLHSVIWKARRLADGDFSPDADGMGELTEAFNLVSKTLQAALAGLEQQKQELAALSETLRREVEARAAMEKYLRSEQARLRKLAATDPLTGIANRRHFFLAAIRELEHLRRTKTPACLAMLDIDHFKTINDCLGHSAGDKALRRIVKIITRVIRPYDLVGRYGGDEFLFLFPGVAREQAHALLERLRNAIEKAKISAGERNPCITVSIGLIELKTEEKITRATLNRLIAGADDSLYAAKKHSTVGVSLHGKGFFAIRHKACPSTAAA